MPEWKTNDASARVLIAVRPLTPKPLLPIPVYDLRAYYYPEVMYLGIYVQRLQGTCGVARGKPEVGYLGATG